MRRLILTAALLAAPAFAQNIPKPEYVPPPAPDGAIVIGVEQKGETVSASVGQQITVALLNQSSVGNGWHVIARPDFLSAHVFKAGSVRPPPAPGRPPMLGGETWATYTFTVNAAGAGELRLDQMSVQKQVLASYSVTIEASAGEETEKEAPEGAGERVESP